MPFPNNPNPSDIHVEGGVQYQYDGNVWIYQGQVGPPGKRGGFEYVFSTSTTASDPGSGYIRYNNGTISSVTAIYIDDFDAVGVNIGSYLSTLNGCQLTIKNQAGSITHIFTVNSITDPTGWKNLSVTHNFGTGVPSSGSTLFIEVGRLGTQGTIGSQGVQGVQGPSGTGGGGGTAVIDGGAPGTNFTAPAAGFDCGGVT